MAPQGPLLQTSTTIAHVVVAVLPWLQTFALTALLYAMWGASLTLFADWGWVGTYAFWFLGALWIAAVAVGTVARFQADQRRVGRRLLFSIVLFPFVAAAGWLLVVLICYV